MEWNSGKIRTF